MFTIHMGVPEMEAFWNKLIKDVHSGKASKGDMKQYRLIGKALVLLANNPRHPSLKSHEIDALTARYGQKIWCAYLQNITPAAGRLFWIDGPGKGDITILAIEPHPKDSKKNAYHKITLSRMT